ncbi:hypothetical protein [Paenibacillus sp. NAIST15-1]|uniref:hypothetical protein n=1 Tax=Paenibacillus sp. NAIST15-1 TaxID=1605994 RepID=UPI00086B05FC|nr:hypothetical protein [Paenibacillus sp. NAIST15-1]GAV11301.1 hypothetical protein PBN151_1228 [Paenibacillus sp. NAIST15-1]
MNNKQEVLNEIKELLYGLYPNAKAINVDVNGDKIKVKPSEEYTLTDTLNKE